MRQNDLSIFAVRANRFDAVYFVDSDLFCFGDNFNGNTTDTAPSRNASNHRLLPVSIAGLCTLFLPGPKSSAIHIGSEEESSFVR